MARIILSIFTEIFIRKIGWQFAFFVGPFCGFPISRIVASLNTLGNATSHSILWNSLKSIGISYSLKV